MTVRMLILLSILLFVLNSLQAQEIQQTSPVKPNSTAPYPKIRIRTSPSSGEEARFNSPSLQWPSQKKAKYSIRISSTKDFDHDLIEKGNIPFALFNPHKKLAPGIWYWQYKVNQDSWNPVDSFLIRSSTRIFGAPEVKTILTNIPADHPRVLLYPAELSGLRKRAKMHKETALVIGEAESYLSRPIPKEASALPTFKGKDDFENEKIASIASKWSGWSVQKGITTLSQAYLLTGDGKYFHVAKRWMLEISKWDPYGPSHTNNFGDAGIMSGLAIGVDTFWGLLTDKEKEQIVKQATIRASQFYKLWIGQVESRSSSMHVWQHILHNLLQTALAFKGEIAEADLWIEYIYELWIAQSPKMGESDGAWFNGTSYFGMNTLSLIDVSSIFHELSGVDFMTSNWFRNNPRWLIQSFPPSSVTDGFCNDGERYPFPQINYAGYSDAMARLLKDPYAAWYARAVTKSLGKEISDDPEFRWFRIRKGLTKKLPDPVKEEDLQQAAVFPDIGVAYMHTTVQKAETDLMLSVRSSPYGPMAHAHADQNTFNIAFGGKRLFYNTGYRPAMGDPHFLGWYKHTQGHNGILIDGKGQPFSDESYGQIPRFLHGREISYAVGDASNAYAGKEEGGKTDLGMNLFRRHFLMLRPSTIVIYDELEADHAAQWSWLLHNDNGLEVDAVQKTILARNEAARARVTLHSSTDLEFQVTDQFTVPVENWTNKINEEGDTMDYKNQWHFKGVSKEKCRKMRYLAIFQIRPDGNFESVDPGNLAGVFTVGSWKIEAEMDTLKPATIQVRKSDNSATFVSGGALTNKGRVFNGKEKGSSKLFELMDGKEFFREEVDQIPASIQKAINGEIR